MNKSSYMKIYEKLDSVKDFILINYLDHDNELLEGVEKLINLVFESRLSSEEKFRILVEL